jgi:hypothetical protein
MQKYNHIKAIFFLGIFSMFLLHQIAPHLHHQHEDSHSHKAVEYADIHDHHHDTPEKEDNSKSGFLDFFLDMHIHLAVADEIPVIGEFAKKLRVVDDVVSDIQALYSYVILKDYKEVEKPSVYHPPNNYFNPYTANLDVRGPPYLG